MRGIARAGPGHGIKSAKHRWDHFDHLARAANRARGNGPDEHFSDRNQPLTPNDTRPNSFDPNIEAGLDAGLDTGLGAGLATVLDAQSFNVPPRPAGAITISLLLPLGSANDDVRALAEALLQAAQLA